MDSRLRASQENPLRESIDGQPAPESKPQEPNRISVIEKPEVARNTENAKIVEEEESEYGEDYYDEEYDESDEVSRSRHSSHQSSRGNVGRLQKKGADLASSKPKPAK